MSADDMLIGQFNLISVMKFPSALSFVVVAFFAYGCDGQTDEPSINVAVGNGLDSNLTGKIITTYQFKPYEFDLATGAGRELPINSNMEYLDSLNDGENHVAYSYFSVTGNQGYVETSYSCLSGPDRSCVSVYNSNFQTVKRVVTERYLQSPAKLSSSGQFVVMSDMDLYYNDYSTVLIMDVTSGNVTDSIDIDHELASRGKLSGHPVVEWGMNDEVIFSVPADDSPTVYVTMPGTTTVDRTISLPSSYTGVITSLDLHPDGTQLLLGYEGNTDALVGRNGLVLVLDLDDLSLRIPAVNQADSQRMPIGENFVSQYVNPMWSPDGTQIMLLNMANIGGTALTPDTIYVDGVQVVNPDIAIGNNLVVLPSDADHLVVNASYEPYVAPASVVQLADPTDSGRLSTRWQGDTFKGGHISWIQ